MGLCLVDREAPSAVCCQAAGGCSERALQAAVQTLVELVVLAPQRSATEAPWLRRPLIWENERLLYLREKVLRTPRSLKDSHLPVGVLQRIFPSVHRPSFALHRSSVSAELATRRAEHRGTKHGSPLCDKPTVGGGTCVHGGPVPCLWNRTLQILAENADTVADRIARNRAIAVRAPICCSFPTRSKPVGESHRGHLLHCDLL